MIKCEYCDNEATTFWGRNSIPVCEACYQLLRTKYWKLTGIWL